MIFKLNKMLSNVSINPSINMSTEFRQVSLDDPIKYNVSIRNIQESSEIPSVYQPKPREIRQCDSIGSFRISSSSLKKRVNPSDEYEEYLRSQKINIVNNQKEEEKLFAYSSNYNPNDKESETEMEIPEGANLIDVIDAKMNYLKEVTEKHLSKLNDNGENMQKELDLLQEDKTNTHFIASTDDRLQMIKHVETRNKPEYMSLEELQRQREENAKKLVDLEKKYNLMKDEKYQRLKEEEEKLNKKYNYKPEITIDLLNAILSKENELFHFDKKLKKKRSLSASKKSQSIKQSDLNKEEEKYVKNLAKYAIKKKMKEEDDNNSEWNYTKINSKNVKGVVNRNDGLPGYFGKEDHSMYYLDIMDERREDKGKFKAPHWGTPSSSLKTSMRVSLNRTFTKGNFTQKRKNNKLNHSARSIHNMDIDDNIKEEEPKKEIDVDAETVKKMLDELIKNIYEEFDVKKIGYVTKSQLCTEAKLDKESIEVFGFENKSDFVEKINTKETKLYNHLSPEELRECIESRYKEYKERKEKEAKEKKEKEEKQIFGNIPKNEDELMEYINNDEEDDDFLPVFHRREILESNSNVKRLQKLKEEISKNDKYLKENNIKTDSNIKKEPLAPKSNKKVSYDNYKAVIDKFNAKEKINFTIPKPFSFQKRNAVTAKTRAKSLSKMQTILDTRDNVEHKELSTRFTANKLKNEIFIGNIDNLIEADKKERRKRVEKRMEKIQAQMKPFSFVEKDEEKLKAKREKIKEIESTKQIFPSFKANPVKWTTKVAMIEDLDKKNAMERAKRVERRAKELLEKSKMPPRLEQHEKAKKEIKKMNDAEMKRANKKKTKKFSNEVKLPNYDKLQKKFEEKIKTDKDKRKKTKIEPFEFHETKKKVSQEEEEVKIPEFKKNALEMIRRLQVQNIEAQPSSTKGLNLLVQQRRREQEEKKKEEEKRKMEDKKRKIEQQKLSKKIHQSERLKNNKEEDIRKMKEKENTFKQGLKEQEKKHNEYLDVIKQKIYNRGFMFEGKDVKGEIGFMEKLRMKQAIEEAMKDNDNEEAEKEEDNNEENVHNNEEVNNEEEDEEKNEEEENNDNKEDDHKEEENNDKKEEEEDYNFDDNNNINEDNEDEVNYK